MGVLSCAVFAGNQQDAESLFPSPEGDHIVVIRGGTQMLYRHRSDSPAVLVRKWGASAIPLWSTDSTKVVVTASDCSTDLWCELYELRAGSLVGGQRITDGIQLSVPGLHHWKARALAWTPDSSSVYIQVQAHGDGGAKEVIFLVRVADAKVVKSFTLKEE